jgi:hypothetical protein
MVLKIVPTLFIFSFAGSVLFVGKSKEKWGDVHGHVVFPLPMEWGAIPMGNGCFLRPPF